MRTSMQLCGIFLLSFLFPFISFSQNALPDDQQKFEAGLAAYLEGEKLSADEYAVFYTDQDEIDSYYIQALTNFIAITSGDDLGKSARYYALVVMSNIASWSYEEGQDSMYLSHAYDLFKEFDEFSKTGFPFYYYYQGTQYVIKYENFDWWRTDLLNKIFVSAGRMGDFQNSMLYAREAYNLNSNDAVNKFRALLFLIVAKESLGQLDAEQAEFGIQYAERYLQLSENERNEVNEWSPAESVADVALDEYSKSAERTPALKKDTGKLYRLFEAVRNINPEKALVPARQLTECSQSLSNQQLFVLANYAKDRDNKLALNLADILAGRTMTCDEMSSLSTMYSQLQQESKSLDLSKREQKCRKDIARQQKRADWERPRLLLGAHAFQYFDDKETRDPGFEFGILHKNKIYSAFYTQINDKAYQMIDLYLQDITIPEFHPRYDGFKAGIGFRKSEDKFQNREWTYYYQLQLAYAEENIRPFDDQVTSLVTNEVFTQSFAPTDHSYRFYAGLGSTYYFYVLGIDWSFNIGLSVNTFDLKDQQHLYNENYSFTNPVFEERKYNQYHFGTLMNVSIITYLLL